MKTGNVRQIHALFLFFSWHPEQLFMATVRDLATCLDRPVVWLCTEYFHILSMGQQMQLPKSYCSTMPLGYTCRRESSNRRFLSSHKPGDTFLSEHFLTPLNCTQGQLLWFFVHFQARILPSALATVLLSYIL